MTMQADSNMYAELNCVSASVNSTMHANGACWIALDYIHSLQAISNDKQCLVHKWAVIRLNHNCPDTGKIFHFSHASQASHPF